MPEPPDFDQIARSMLASVGLQPTFASAFAEQLHLVWNARGAADMAAVDAELSWLVDTPLTAAGPSVKALVRVLRTLDR